VAVNKKIMNYAKGRFINNLAKDFQKWADEQPADAQSLPRPDAPGQAQAQPTRTGSSAGAR
jgi:hypothetical protein